MRRRVGVIVVGAAVATVLAACGTAKVGSSSAAGGSTAGAAVKIGVIGPLTTAASTYGIAESNGIKMAVDEWNAKGGVLGKKIQVVTRDSKGDPSVATTQALELVQSSGATALFGPIVNTAALAVTKMSDQLNVPIMGTLGATTPVVYPDGPDKAPYKWVYRVLVSSPVQVQALVKYGQQQGWKRWAIVYENDAYGQPTITDLQTALKSAGGTLVASEGIATDATDATAQALAVKAADPDVVLVWTIQAPASKVVSALSAAGWTKPIVSSNAQVSPQFYQLAGQLANGIVSTGLKAQFDSSGPTTDFTKQYTAQFQIPPTLWAFASYDAANLYLNAVKKAGTSDPAKVRAELDKTAYQGLTGKITFTTKDHDGITADDVVVVKLNNQQAVPVS